IAHRFIPVTTHGNRHKSFPIFGPFHTTPPKFLKSFLILAIIPAPIITMSLPFRLRTRHRLVVRSTYHNAHLIGECPDLWIVVVKSNHPHGWPKKVTFQAQKQFKNGFVKLAIVSIKGMVDPTRQSRIFVVQKDATVLYCRLAVGIYTWLDVEIRLTFYRHIGPIIPRRHTHLFRQFIDPIDRSAFVAPRYDQCGSYPWSWLLNRRNDEFLPLSFQLFPRKQSFSQQAIDRCRLPNRSDPNSRFCTGDRFGTFSGDLFEILLQAFYCPYNTFIIVYVYS